MSDLDKLLEDLKDCLNITWDEDETNRKLKTIINDSIKTMNYKLGAEIDYSSSGQEHNLFINYCMYVYNNCSNEFDNNYLNELYQVRQKYEVMNYEKEQLQ